MGEIHSHFDGCIFFKGVEINHQLVLLVIFWRLELIGLIQFSPSLSFGAFSLEAKDALKEATKEAAKKRKKEMQTATEDCKTASFELEVSHPI